VTVTNQLPNPKWLSLDEAVTRRERLRQEGSSLILTNGCFDLLHSGHIYFLINTAALGDVLWIALNSDESVRDLKGSSRPIQNEKLRAYNLAALECISGIITFKSKRLNEEIQALKPDIYAKAGDYSLETIDKEERGALEAAGTKIVFIPYLEGYSTTELINKINHQTD
jgi:rfaE bifunctional protein nucleotidyltransferase chain/domain